MEAETKAVCGLFSLHSKLYSDTVTMSVVRVCLFLHVCFSTRTNWIQLWALFDLLPALFKDERPFRAREPQQTTVILNISSETKLRFVYKSFWVRLIRSRPIQQMTWTIGVNTSALFSQPHRLHWKTGLGSNLAKIEKPYVGFEVCFDLQAKLFIFPYFKETKQCLKYFEGKRFYGTSLFSVVVFLWNSWTSL